MPLLSSVVLLVCAGQQDAEYNGKSLAAWKAQTGATFAFPQRREAIRALRSIAEKHTDGLHPEPEQVMWVETEIVPTLVELLQDKDAAVRRKAAEIVKGFPMVSRKFVPPLLECLNDQDDYIRVLASGSLIRIDPNESARVIPVLLDVIQKKSPSSGSAANVLASTGADGKTVLVALLDDKNPDVRRIALDTIRWQLRHEGLKLSMFTRLLQDEDVQVRANAASCIANLRPTTKEAVSAIIPLLQDKDHRVRCAVIEGLATMRADPAQAVPEMVKLADDANVVVRYSLAGSLGDMGPMAVPTLAKLLDDKDVGVRYKAANSLGDIGPAAREAVPTLKRHLTDMEEVGIGGEGMRICHHAGNALAKILGDKSYLKGLPDIPPDGR